MVQNLTHFEFFFQIAWFFFEVRCHTLPNVYQYTLYSEIRFGEIIKKNKTASCYLPVYRVEIIYNIWVLHFLFFLIDWKYIMGKFTFTSLIEILVGVVKKFADDQIHKRLNIFSKIFNLKREWNEKKLTYAKIIILIVIYVNVYVVRLTSVNQELLKDSGIYGSFVQWSPALWFGTLNRSAGDYGTRLYLISVSLQYHDQRKIFNTRLLQT